MESTDRDQNPKLGPRRHGVRGPRDWGGGGRLEKGWYEDFVSEDPYIASTTSIGHMLHKDANSITRVAIHWTPEVKQKGGRPKTTWRRTVEAEMKNVNHSWDTIQRLACDRQG